MIEVADAATVGLDTVVKRGLYALAGVPEYWVLDVAGRLQRRPGPFVRRLRDGRSPAHLVMCDKGIIMLAAIAPPPPLAEEPLRRKRFTRDEVNRMLDDGYFDGQRFELIDGELIDKMGQNPPHRSTVTRVHSWLSEQFPRRVLMQAPMDVVGPDGVWSVPEPDVIVLAEDKAEYDCRHPRADETVLLVEVSDTSLSQDLVKKRKLFARAGAPEYWVFDIQGKRLIVHRTPVDGDYTEVREFTAVDIVSPACKPDAIVVVGELLTRSR